MFTPSRFVITVSIHAPAWGATIQVHHFGAFARVSIHAPAWGATIPFPVEATGYSSFNPRSRVGSDTDSPTNDSCIVSFQSTLPRGERPSE